jgi:hypothetical protein
LICEADLDGYFDVWTEPGAAVEIDQPFDPADGIGFA